MSSRIRAWLILAVLAVAAAFWLWHSARYLQQTRADLLAARQQQTMAEQQVKRLEQSPHSRADSVSEKAPKESASDRVISKQKADPRVAPLFKDPKLQAAYVAAKKGQIDRDYSALIRRLNLSPIQAEALKGLLLQREEQKLDLAGSVPDALRSVGGSTGKWFTSSLELGVGGASADPDVQAATQLMQQSNQALQAAATDLLGPDGWQQLYDYWRALPMRPWAEKVAGSLATSGSPLTSDQVDQLTQILAQNSTTYAQGKPANTNQVNWDLALQQAKSVLSPAQLTAAKANLDVYRAGSTLNNLVRSAAAGP